MTAHRILILPSTPTTSTPRQAPALDLLDGPTHRLVRRALAEVPAHLRPCILITTARHGLIDAARPIATGEPASDWSPSEADAERLARRLYQEGATRGELALASGGGETWRRGARWLTARAIELAAGTIAPIGTPPGAIAPAILRFELPADQAELGAWLTYRRVAA